MWRPSAAQLLLGNARGSAVLYSCAAMAVMPLHGRLGKAVCSGAWVELAEAPGRCR